MAHNHLNIKDTEIGHDETKGKQVRVSVEMIATLAGGVLLLASLIARWRWLYGGDSEMAKLCAMIGAVLLGVPVIWHALRCMLQGHMHMDELVALAIIAAFAVSVSL